jgi:hypothetical protein
VEEEETEVDLECWGWAGRKSRGILDGIICILTAVMAALGERGIVELSERNQRTVGLLGLEIEAGQPD